MISALPRTHALRPSSAVNHTSSLASRGASRRRSATSSAAHSKSAIVVSLSGVRWVQIASGELTISASASAAQGPRGHTRRTTQAMISSHSPACQGSAKWPVPGPSPSATRSTASSIGWR
jgi:hypothetical protein